MFAVGHQEGFPGDAEAHDEVAANDFVATANDFVATANDFVAAANGFVAAASVHVAARGDEAVNHGVSTARCYSA